MFVFILPMYLCLCKTKYLINQSSFNYNEFVIVTVTFIYILKEGAHELLYDTYILICQH
jgi:hypothetical protein